MSKTIFECAMRNTNELHEPMCQNNEAAKQFFDADCRYENGVFTLLSLPCSLPPLFTVRFTAPADYTKGNTLTMKGRTFAFQTSDLKQGKEKQFAAGAVVQLMVDMERGLAFFPSDYVDLSTYVTESRCVNTEAPLYGGGDLGSDRTLGIEDATTLRKGAVQLSNSIDSDSESCAATAKAVKTVHEFATGKADANHTHPMADVAGLDLSLAAKAPIESPAFSGTPTAPTPSALDKSDRLATTKWVKEQEYVTVTDHKTELTAYVPKTRCIVTTAPLLGGGDLTADRTISIADASTMEKGAVQLSAETNNSSIAHAATASAVKATYDFAATKADRSIATGSSDGLMSAIDKARFDAGGMVYPCLKVYVRVGGTATNDGLTEESPFGTVQQAIDAMHKRYRGRITHAYIDVGPGRFASIIVGGKYDSGTSFYSLEIGGAGVDVTTLEVSYAVNPGDIVDVFSIHDCTLEYRHTGPQEYGAIQWGPQIGDKTLRTGNFRLRIHPDSLNPHHHIHSAYGRLTYYMKDALFFEGSAHNGVIYITNGGHLENYGLTAITFANGNTKELIRLNAGSCGILLREVSPTFLNFNNAYAFNLNWGASLTIRGSTKKAWMNGKPNFVDTSSEFKEF